MSEMRIAVALITNATRHVLLVRKRGTAAFMQPGGKIEQGEESGSALVRELFEELALEVPPDRFRYLGSAIAPAANEPGITIQAEIFALALDRDVVAQAEIEEAVWVAHDNPDGLLLAPLTRNCILPLVLEVTR